MIDECVDHGCKGYGLGYATAWIRLPALGKKYNVGTSQLCRIIKGEARVTC